MERLEVLSAAAKKPRGKKTPEAKADCMIKIVRNADISLCRFRVYVSHKFTRLTNAGKWGWAYIESCDRFYLFCSDDLDSASGLEITVYKPVPLKKYSSICIMSKDLFNKISKLGGTIERDLVWDCKAQMFYFSLEKEESNER